MRIAVIGAGNVGGTLGRRWAALGHSVTFGVREFEQGAAAVKGGDTLPDGVRVASPADAVRDVDVVVLTTPWAAVFDALRGLGAETGALAGVPLLDATNPIGPGLRVVTGPTGESGAEQIQALARDALVVKVFNTTGFENMGNTGYPAGQPAMFYAGDNAGAKAIARELAEGLGFEALDAGGLYRARALEHLATLWIAMAGGIGTPAQGRDIAFMLGRR